MAELERPELEAALASLAAGIDVSGGERVLDAVAARIAAGPAGGVAPAGSGVGRRQADRHRRRGTGNGPTPGGPLRRAVSTPRARRAVLAAAVVVALVAAGIGLSPRARHAVADLLGLRGVDIDTRPPGSAPSSIPAGPWSAGLRPVSEAEAETELGRPLRRLDPGRYGQPGGWAVSGAVRSPRGPSGLVVASYPPSAALPASSVSQVGAVLAQFVGEVEAPVLRKMLPPGGRIEPVSVGGRPGFWVSGAHEVGMLDRSGSFAVDTVRLAGDTLLWQDGDVTFRLESGLGRDEAVAAAESLR